MTTSFTQLIAQHKDEIALVVVDVQKDFCDPKGWLGTEDTDRICGLIQQLAPAFRKAGIKVYAVYTENSDVANQGFHKFQPEAEDVLIHKTQDSPFPTSDLAAQLKRDGRRLVLTCGFNINACVLETMRDARKAGFETGLVEDLSGADFERKYFISEALTNMDREGFKRGSAAQALAALAGGPAC